MNTQQIQMAIIGAGSFVTGGAVGFQIGIRVMKKWAMEEIDRELTKIREEFAGCQSVFRSPEEESSDHHDASLAAARARAEELASTYSGHIETATTHILDEDEIMAIDSQRISEEMDEDFSDEDDQPDEIEDSDEEEPVVDADMTDLEGVDRSRPYIISEAEFREGDYDKITLAYYEGDDVLVDDRGMPISSIDKTVSDEALIAFGQRSNDPNIVYVRNEAINSDFEIARDDRSWIETLRVGAPRASRGVRFREEE